MHRLLLCFTLLVSLTAAHSDTHDDIITTEVRATIERMAEKWNNRDLLGALAFYMNSPDTRLIRDAKVYQGWNAIYEHYKALYQNDPEAYMVEVVVRDMTIEAYNANTASVFYQYDAKRSDGTPFSGATFMIMKRSGPYWRVTHSNMSSGRFHMREEPN